MRLIGFMNLLWIVVAAGMVNWNNSCCCGESMFAHCRQHPTGHADHHHHHDAPGHACYKSGGHSAVSETPAALDQPPTSPIGTPIPPLAAAFANGPELDAERMERPPGIRPPDILRITAHRLL